MVHSYKKGEEITTNRDKYRFTGLTLGQGTFATIYQADSNKYNRKVALKITTKENFSSANQAMLKSEISIMQELRHPNILRILDATENVKAYFLIFEAMATDLLEEIREQDAGKLTARMARFLMYQMCNAVFYLHHKDIVHGDLKPENVLLDQVIGTSALPQAKICDFNYARKIPNSEKRLSVKGSLNYMSPEILSNEEHDRSIDIWGLGVILYVCLSGHFPFVGKNEDALKAHIKHRLKNLDEFYKDECFKDPSTLSMLKTILVENPNRPTIKDVLEMDYFSKKELKDDISALKIKKKTKINKISSQY